MTGLISVPVQGHVALYSALLWHKEAEHAPTGWREQNTAAVNPFYLNPHLLQRVSLCTSHLLYIYANHGRHVMKMSRRMKIRSPDWLLRPGCKSAQLACQCVFQGQEIISLLSKHCAIVCRFISVYSLCSDLFFFLQPLLREDKTREGSFAVQCTCSVLGEREKTVIRLISATKKAEGRLDVPPAWTETERHHLSLTLALHRSTNTSKTPQSGRRGDDVLDSPQRAGGRWRQNTSCPGCLFHFFFLSKHCFSPNSFRCE